MEIRRVGILSVAQLIGIALLPKCPMCLGSYLALFGALGLREAITYDRLFWISLVSAGLAFSVISTVAIRARDARGALLAVLGAGLIFSGKYGPLGLPATLVGIALLSSPLIRARPKKKCCA
jgi:hypothetical protein